MWVLLTAVATASLLGSTHCVGMCGPLAIWASGATVQQSRHRTVVSSGLYHLGRLTTYLMMGVIAGGVGGLIDSGGQAIGIQVAAARVVGGLMVAFGVVRLWMLSPWYHGRVKELVPSRVGGILVRLRPVVFALPWAGRSYAVGLLTTFLPCGWLYLFALVAAGTGSVWLGPLVMATFWLGTVPALVALVAGTKLLSTKFTIAVPAIAAVLLVVIGGLTATGRGFANLDSLAELQREAGLTEMDSSSTAAQRVSQLGDASLPCCRVDAPVNE
ncbi:MAG: sulfite exporter TauE/SafE family protein [Pirellulaceae bacterium]|nr:sulfite exporter TauE/SafE family protein [Pirellulaceae bacterium]